MTCKHWTDCGARDGGRCGLKRATVSFGVCQTCPDSTKIGWVSELVKSYTTEQPQPKAAPRAANFPGLRIFLSEKKGLFPGHAYLYSCWETESMGCRACQKQALERKYTKLLENRMGTEWVRNAGAGS